MSPIQSAKTWPVSDDPDQISLVSMVHSIRRSRAWIIAAALVVGLAAAMHAATRPVVYASTARFRPQIQKQSSAVAGLAAQFGLNLPSGDGGMSAAEYADLVSSREILRPVSQEKYAFARDGTRVTGTLVDIYSPGKGVAAARREGTIGLLGQQVKAAVSKTGTVALTVTTPYPELSQELALSIMSEVNTFNLRNRQAQATPEREFVEERLGVAGGELHAAEARLESFLEANRQYTAAPQLQLERDRLARDVAMRQQVYTSLAQAYEQARIDEVRNMPSIIVLEHPEIAYAPVPHRILSRLLLGLVLGAVLGLLLGFLRDTWQHVARVAETREEGDRDIAGPQVINA